MKKYAVLLVDDDPIFRKSVAKMIEKVGLATGFEFAVDQAEDGFEGMKCAAGQNYDCILVDYMMPGGNGLSFLQDVVHLQGESGLIVLTGHGSEQLAVQAMKQGASDYLVKADLSLETLQRAILNAIEKVELKRQLERQRYELLEAERQRVMIESLTHACKEVGQPTRVIGMYLDLMEIEEKNPEKCELIKACRRAVDSLNDILDHLQNLDAATESAVLNTKY